MKKLLVANIVLLVVLIVGAFWGEIFFWKYAPEDYGEMIEQKDHEIENLKDSIRIMNAKIEFYDEGMKWLKDASEEELERSIKILRSLPYDELVP